MDPRIRLLYYLLLVEDPDQKSKCAIALFRDDKARKAMTRVVNEYDLEMGDGWEACAYIIAQAVVKELNNEAGN